MGRRISIFLIIVTCLFSPVLRGQNAQLAQSFYLNKEYDKALEEYLLLYRKESTENYYPSIVNCYIQLKDYDGGEKFCKKHLKISFAPYLVKIDLAQFFELEGKSKDAQEWNNEVINDLGPYVQQIIEVGKKFMQVKNYTYAIKTYEKGRKELKNSYPFALELAEVYAATGQKEKMVAEILFVLNFGEGYLEGVKNAIFTELSDDKNGKKAQLFKDELVNIIQKNPNEAVYVDLLIWMYLEESNFNGAFVYSKAIDKRQEEQGRRLMELGRLARANGEYGVAQKCYDYVISTYPETYNYQLAKMDLVEVLKEKLDQNPVKSQEDILALEQAYATTLKEIGRSEYAIKTMRGYAELLAFQLGRGDEALNLLDQAVSYPRASSNELALCKLLKGDIYVFENDVWEAALLYGQIASDYNNDAIGHQAKLKVAQAYYYTGNFDWAKTQLDVLKTATSKLIANDAMQLSVLISDVLGMDTSTIALSLYAKADLWYYQGNSDSALFQLNQLIYSFPEHLSILDDAHYLQAKIYQQKQQWEPAIASYQKAVDYNDLLVDDALLQMARIYESVLGDKDKASKCYERIILDFESSIYAAEARAKYRALRGE